MLRLSSTMRTRPPGSCDPRIVSSRDVFSLVKGCPENRRRSVKACLRDGRSERDPAGEDVLEHHTVAGEGIERVAEGGRAALFEEEVADPGEGVATGQGRQQPSRIGPGNRRGDEGQRSAAADEMQASRDAVAMLSEVERIELAEAGKAGHALVLLVRRDAGHHASAADVALGVLDTLPVRFLRLERLPAELAAPGRGQRLHGAEATLELVVGATQR